MIEGGFGNNYKSPTMAATSGVTLSFLCLVV